MADLGEITVRLRADASGFTQGMQAATASTKTFYEGAEQAGNFAGGSERGIRRMELALGAASAEAVGANHTLGLFTEGLLLFGGGEEAVLGVLGVIGAAFAAYKDATFETEAFTKANDEAFKTLREGIGTTGTLRLKLDELSDAYASVEAHIAMLNGPESGKSFFEGLKELFGQSTDVTAIEDATKAATVKDGIRRIHNMLKAEVAKKTQVPGDEYNDLGDEIGQADEELKVWLDDEDELRARQASQDAAVRPGLSFDLTKGIDEQTDQVVDGAKRALARMQAETDHADEQFVQSMADTGLRAGETLIRGLMDGTKNFGKLLEKELTDVLFSIINNAINAALKSGSGGSGAEGILGAVGSTLLGFGPGPGAAIGGAAGGAISASVQGSGRSGITVVPPPQMTPFDAARDAWWQSTFRETGTVAASQGYVAP